MKKVLLIVIGLIIVFGISVTGFCQDLTEDLQVTIGVDKGVYKIHNGLVSVDVKVELKNIGNRELEIKHPGPLYHPCPLEFTVEPTGERVSWLLTISNIIKPPCLILKSQEVIRMAGSLGITTKVAGNYKLSARYTMDKVNYIISNTISIKIIEEKTLEVVIESDKKVYEQNEDIMIGGAIKNISEKSVALHLAPNWLPRFEISSDSLTFPLRSNPVKLRIAGGEINYEKPYLKFTPYEDKRVRTGNLYNLKWYFWDVHGEKPPSPFASNGRLKPGRYTIRLVDFNYSHKGENDLFEVNSNPITIKVIEEK